jgi:hypothetical protein
MKMADLTISLTQRLRTKADMINMGEKIAWGSETELMDEAADALDAVMRREERHLAALQRVVDWFEMPGPDYNKQYEFGQDKFLECIKDALHARSE